MRLKSMLLGAAAAALVAGTTPAPAMALAPVAVQEAKISIDVDDDNDVWYTNPLWIAIGAVALIAVIGLIVAAGRKGNTTVVK